VKASAEAFRVIKGVINKHKKKEFYINVYKHMNKRKKRVKPFYFLLIYMYTFYILFFLLKSLHGCEPTLKSTAGLMALDNL